MFLWRSVIFIYSFGKSSLYIVTKESWGDENLYQETSNVELKRELTDAEKNEIVAFLNTMDGIVLDSVEYDGSLY